MINPLVGWFVAIAASKAKLPPELLITFLRHKQAHKSPATLRRRARNRVAAASRRRNRA